LDYHGFDCTELEGELQEWLNGPQEEWSRDHHPSQGYAPGPAVADPDGREREKLVAEVAATYDAALQDMPPRLATYCLGRLTEATARKQALAVPEILADAAALGDRELRAFALEHGAPRHAGDLGNWSVEIGATSWGKGIPGVASLSLWGGARPHRKVGDPWTTVTG
jgi:hypothetical protein